MGAKKPSILNIPGKLLADKSVDAVYIRIVPRPHKKRVKLWTRRESENVLLDYDIHGHLAGIELLNVSKLAEALGHAISRLTKVKAVH